MNKMKQKRIILIFIILCVIVCIMCILALPRIYRFNYVLNSNGLQTIDDYQFYIDNQHASFNTEGTCFYDDTVQIRKFIKDENEIVEQDDTTNLFGYELYVGYFKTIDEAIYFGELNYKLVSEYLVNNYGMSKELIDRFNYDYRIEEICDSEVKGYVVLFASLEAYIVDTSFNIKKGMSFIENLNNIIDEDEVLSYFNVFSIFDLYQGNVEYMTFNNN